ncbi:MAG: hypothetical protein EOM59_19475 [Clostridia bacterium]|nr:hypothetical protein [Clostridia bacterium]
MNNCEAKSMAASLYGGMEMNEQTIKNYISTLHDPEKTILSETPLHLWEYVQSLYDTPQPLHIIAGELLDNMDDIYEGFAMKSYFKSLDKFY